MENPTEIIYIRNKLMGINNMTTNSYGTVALNTYQIYPKTIIYPINGSFSAGTQSSANQFLGADAASYNADNFSIGINYVREFVIYTTTSAGTKYVDVEYVDGSGNYATSTDISINDNGTITKLNAININRITWSDHVDNVNLNNVLVRTRDKPTIAFRDSIPSSTNSANQYSGGSSVITVPNSYTGVISDLYFASTNKEDIKMIVKDRRNNIKYIRYMADIPSVNGRYCYLGPINHPLDAGDSVFFASVFASTNYQSVHAIVTLTAI